MKGQLKVATPQEYLSQLAEPRRTEIAQLDALIRKTAPQLEPGIHSGMLSYGPYHYKYASGREGDWFRIGLASNANYISLYAMAADANGYVAERYRPRLPRANIGKACVRFKRVSDLDLEALTELIRLTASTGFTEVLADSGESAGKQRAAAKSGRTDAMGSAATSDGATAKGSEAKSGPATAKGSAVKSGRAPAKGSAVKSGRATAKGSAVKPARAPAKGSSTKPARAPAKGSAVRSGRAAAKGSATKTARAAAKGSAKSDRAPTKARAVRGSPKSVSRD